MPRLEQSFCITSVLNISSSNLAWVMTPGQIELSHQALHVSIDLLQFIPARMGAQWLSGRALDSRPKGRGFEPHRRHCVVSLSKNINPSLVLVQPRKIRPFITERLLMGRKESNQTNKHSRSSQLLSYAL